VDKSRFKVYSDLEGYQTPTGGTIPATLAVTELKPDMVISDKVKKTVNIVELTVPFEGNIKLRNTYKTDKYSHFLTDITVLKPSITAFEVGARGYLTADNEARLKDIHSYCGKEIKQRKFLENISALAITGSYLIFTARKQPTWSTPGFLGPPF
jgi:hypothetical protein